jgi:hypothetical protein
MANINLYRVSVPDGAYSKVSWIECGGYYGPTQYLQESLRSIDFQAQNLSVSASAVATISIIGYCNDDCTGCYLIGETTTTSTTIPPVNFTLTPSCEGTGINGTGKIIVNGFSGGNGTYTSVAIGSSAGAALSATPIALSGASTYSFTGVFNGTWHIILRDSSGASTTKTTAVNCTNTTTTTSTSTTSTTSTSTSTTSTTTAAVNCTYSTGTAVVVYPTTSTTSTTTVAPTTTSTSTTSTSTTSTSTTSTTSTTTLAPVTVHWDLTANNGGGASLEILNGSNSIIFSQTTSGVAQSGTFVTDAGQAPLSVRYSWTAGSGNIVRYRICDGSPGSELYNGPEIDISMGYDTYLLSPTPLEFWIHGSSGVNTHPVNCDGTPWVSTTTTTTTTTLAPSYKTLLVSVGSPDRAASDDGYVYFDFIDASTGLPQTIGFNTNKSSYNTGYCVNEYDSTFVWYYYDGGAQTAASYSSVSYGSTCTPNPS